MVTQDQTKQYFENAVKSVLNDLLSKKSNNIRTGFISSVDALNSTATVRLDLDSSEVSGVRVSSSVKVEEGSKVIMLSPDPLAKTNNIIVASLGSNTFFDQSMESILLESTKGWVSSGETWTYASASSPTYTLTVSGDLTAKYSAGMKIRIYQGTARYFIITKVSYSSPNTTLTLYGGTSYALDNGVINSPCYSTGKAPYGFPCDPNLWTITTSSTSDLAQADPSAGTWYNLGSLSIVLPIGSWSVYYAADADFSKNATTAVEQKATLSTANNSESDSDFTDQFYFAGASGNLRAIKTLSRQKPLTIATPTTYYLNALTNTAATVVEISWRGDIATTVIRAVCSYL